VTVVGAPAVVFNKEMQPSKGGGGPRVKLNRNAFKLEQSFVPKRRRLSRSPECTDPVASVQATRGSTEPVARAGSAPRQPSRSTPGPLDARRQEPARITAHDHAPCMLRDCNNNNNNNNTLRRKQVRCHVHLALRFCGSDKSVTQAEAQQSVSCTVSRYVNGDVRVNTSNSSGDAIEPNPGSTGKSDQGAGVKTEEIRLGAPVKKDGRAACLRSSNQVLGFSVGDRILDVAEDIEGWSESADKKDLRMPDCEKITLSSTVGTANEDFTSMSPVERPEEGAAEDEMCETGNSNRSPSPLPAPEGSVITGGDLDAMRAYKDDAIVLDVIQDDPDLFGPVVMSMAETSASKANPAALQREKNMCIQTDQTSLVRRTKRIAWGLESKRKNVQTGGDVHAENNDVFCKGEVNASAKGSKSQPTFGTKWPPATPIDQQEQMVPDCNKKQTTDLYVNRVNPGWTGMEGDAYNNVHTAAGKDVNIVRPLPTSYCWYYFSEHHTCLRSCCWFLHVPREDDEKFCMDIVRKFCRVGTPPLVQRAEEIFAAYYRINSPGVSFSENIVNQLLSSLLSLALLKDLVSVINTLLTHKRMPPPEFVMALYEHVRERGILNFVPELIHLTSKITEAGCVFSAEQCEMMQLHLESLQVSRHQMDNFCAVKYRALATNPHTAELSELGEAVVRVELCKQQEDWPALAHVFCTVCGGRHSAGELSRFCCCVTMALLTESRDKLTVPYESFAESVCQEVPTDEMIKSFLGRVGVSLMFSYYRTQDWTKGLKLLCVMSRLQMEFTMLKGLFSSENGASRCQLVTIATEFFLNSGSIEGALNMLKANEWFVSSTAWPCDQADIQNRRRVLTLLAEKTSYRDTLEVLTNLPGLKQPVDGVQTSEHNTMFNAHLRRCVMNHVLPVGADTLEFMLIQGIPPDTTELQQLLHKLGKQNSWRRARTLFGRAHSAGYYSGVVCDKDSLALPCSLTEIEMTLAFEMFIACICTSLQNPSDSSRPLLITLKRCSGHEVAVESVYLAAGCRLLSAALIPNPKLSIRYTAVSQEQEQLFNLDRGSAAKWFSHNRSWAQGLWANTHTLTQAKKAFY
ncbi:hypothetical protein QTP86_020848, partial [Hemibagrus guttatus]